MRIYISRSDYGIKIDFKNLQFLDPNLEREYEEDKKGILDVLLELNDGTNITIEMQVLRQS